MLAGGGVVAGGFLAGRGSGDLFRGLAGVVDLAGALGGWLLVATGCRLRFAAGGLLAGVVGRGGLVVSTKAGVSCLGLGNGSC